MFRFIFRLVFGVLGVLFGTSIIVWVLYNYLVALSYDKIGYGASVALVLFALVLASTVILARLRRAHS